MERDEVKVRLLGPHGRIDARAVYRALGSLIDLVSSFDEGDAKARWVISRAEEGSLALAIRPAGIVEFETLVGLDVFTHGLERLAEEPGAPEAWDEMALRRVLEIANVATIEGVEGVELSWGEHEPVRVDRVVKENIQESLSERHMSLGSVRGHLDRYFNRQSRREVGLVDASTGMPVRVRFGPALQDRVLAALEQDVVAWGEVHRNVRGDKIRLHMEDFEVIERPQLPQSVETLAGALGEDWTGGTPSVDWVKEQRRGE